MLWYVLSYNYDLYSYLKSGSFFSVQFKDKTYHTSTIKVPVMKCFVVEEIKRGTSEQTRLAGEIKKLQAELEEARVQATLARLDLDEEKRKFQDEVASLQQLVTGKS